MTTPSVPQDTLLMALWSTQLNSYVFVAVVALWVSFLSLESFLSPVADPGERLMI
ncbi:hypothetical protein AZE42_05537 [Rhizopogon vesiculosus]|uniref:Uncharacterized protein n=1 Tax=Rhizopogon vesiculosus TaxID=180088 RepID=A0A1J8R5X0_9AGAM|nr:hypothetical protein AZE42_05537 [Rhizopogon vesiculosus]